MSLLIIQPLVIGINYEDSKDTTLNLQSAQHVTKSALKESKAVTPAKQVSAILNIYDYGDVAPQTPNANHTNL